MRRISLRTSLLGGGAGRVHEVRCVNLQIVSTVFDWFISLNSDYSPVSYTMQIATKAGHHWCRTSFASKKSQALALKKLFSKLLSKKFASKHQLSTVADHFCDKRDWNVLNVPSYSRLNGSRRTHHRLNATVSFCLLNLLNCECCSRGCTLQQDTHGCKDRLANGSKWIKLILKEFSSISRFVMLK